MNFKDDAEVRELVRRFETCEIHPAEFKHYQHLAVALWYVSNFHYEDASLHMRRGIQKLAAAHGKTGYHETITLFWLELVRRFFVAAEPDVPIYRLVNQLVSKYADKTLIGNYYSQKLLESAEAKSGWVEPDVRSIDIESKPAKTAR